MINSKPFYFSDISSIQNFISDKKNGSISLNHQNLKNYEGVVFYSGIHFNLLKNEYQLNLEWICFGLDLFGDNLVESYVYQFNSLKLLLDYLEKKYQLKATDINPNYKFNDDLFPNPIKNKDKKTTYIKFWNQFQKDFKQGLFLDNSQNLIYSSSNEK